MPRVIKNKKGKTRKHYCIQNDILENWNKAKDLHYTHHVSDTYAVECALERDINYLKENEEKVEDE